MVRRGAILLRHCLVDCTDATGTGDTIRAFRHFGVMMHTVDNMATTIVAVTRITTWPRAILDESADLTDEMARLLGLFMFAAAGPRPADDTSAADTTAFRAARSLPSHASALPKPRGRGEPDRLVGRLGGGNRGELGLDDRLDVVDADEHILRLEIAVYHRASGVQVVEAEEDLFRDLLDYVLRHAAVLIPLDEQMAGREPLNSVREIKRSAVQLLNVNALNQTASSQTGVSSQTSAHTRGLGGGSTSQYQVDEERAYELYRRVRLAAASQVMPGMGRNGDAGSCHACGATL